ncbi:hypothetical protein CNEO4_190006 [Clostridium neonatale]|nr:hypothetical protein CNEO3_20005 [Clostridium neonatale]CAI3574248.1 hypothetical protein CNEO4_190006 [Clostridium neonatale]CAI3620392.1 hypothetical protein CNEO3_410006 [Clostridium neonatale]CAI3704016.1 hypothetical protein CNEO2_620005 [Clostridium neonatale]
MIYYNKDIHLKVNYYLLHLNFIELKTLSSMVFWKTKLIFIA